MKSVKVVAGIGIELSQETMRRARSMKRMLVLGEATRSVAMGNAKAEFPVTGRDVSHCIPR